ncbi:hypothetical protein ACFWOG_40565 [Kitasatospora sp. NPDC058406]|uniref:hypothetical protein n=1 Tax=Kitasatospora sp. NPDC058406 TaxID=3346483 RepID=UPI00365B934C
MGESVGVRAELAQHHRAERLQERGVRPGLVIAGVSGSPCGRIDTPPPGRTTARQPTE